ncbi:hypothetical protein ACU3L3_13255 [Priestia endophytica]|jgi:hypothetical protein|uniref:Uncharacterized protein n=1 Tax=Priestia endophytica DSM 13796 TaxID=1121089 RepID=A0A1I6BDT5_9BACI|nr:hypothetical protein [Priestia endophytica]KYG26237.1 hypothetical protein AZF06_17070 [Priestia endophytica]MBG9813860.1 hypothetical protein [Priestia endophytica]SFQ79125.1 hypothetical protein SAMN02745910_03515 [Priestia endophytica DSM 13796]
MSRYTYTFKEKFERIIIDLSQSHLENSFLIENSLGSDILAEFDEIQEEFNRYLTVLTGEEEMYKGGGNTSIIRAYENFTLFESLFPDGAEEVICAIETIEFMKILLDWAQEVFKCDRKYERISEEQLKEQMLWLREAWTEINKYGENAEGIKY